MDKRSNEFSIFYHGLKAEMELYTKDYIVELLTKMEKDKIVSSFHFFDVPKKNIAKELRHIYKDEEGKDKYYYFAYIKFFECKNSMYGLVGGKTNYSFPDISFDYLGSSDDRMARVFLNENNLNWSRTILIINHEPTYEERRKDEKQALFLEMYLQRYFHLFNS